MSAAVILQSADHPRPRIRVTFVAGRMDSGLRLRKWDPFQKCLLY